MNLSENNNQLQESNNQFSENELKQNIVKEEKKDEILLIENESNKQDFNKKESSNIEDKDNIFVNNANIEQINEPKITNKTNLNINTSEIITEEISTTTITTEVLNENNPGGGDHGGGASDTRPNRTTTTTKKITTKVTTSTTPSPKKQYTCPDGYTLSNNKCIITTNAKLECDDGLNEVNNDVKGCISFNEGYEKTGNTCPTGTTEIHQLGFMGTPDKYMCYPLHDKLYKCDDGYILNNRTCTKTIDAIIK